MPALNQLRPQRNKARDEPRRANPSRRTLLERSRHRSGMSRAEEPASAGADCSPRRAAARPSRAYARAPAQPVAVMPEYAKRPAPQRPAAPLDPHGRALSRARGRSARNPGLPAPPDELTRSSRRTDNIRRESF